MKTLTLVLSLILVTNAFAQSDKKTLGTESLCVDELKAAETLANLSIRNLDWDTVENAEVIYQPSGTTNLHIHQLRYSKLTEEVRQLFSQASEDAKIGVDNITIPQRDGGTVVTNFSVTVK